ncbi:TIGR01906 family membrane protein [Arthrobacter sp. zg-Y877]|uniref:TIGR01906 family membrane protein n=1 Tax=Arthrobacter sp. zg-Y877 TaxID=3049074 RepID=UPI0025A4BA69|nr:TIGR01906 family membrane protein [Arthrobacter sp. zg-Y877]MDM7990516.1 TIGR01906 family membrane protein [Arthrobacter sp. zg-Y877]
MKEEAVASHDETPTHRSTAGGEPSDGAPVQSPGEAESGAGSSAVTSPGLSGAGEHADWDAEFDSLTGTERAEAEAAREAEAAEPEAAAEPEPDIVPADSAPADSAATDTSADSEFHAAESHAAEPDTVESDTVEAHAVEADVLAAEQAESGSPGTAVAGGTVPGGHPKVAQRSQLPMRRASTLPDLSGYAPGDADSDALTDAADLPAEGTEEERPQAGPSGSYDAGQHASGRSGSHEAAPAPADEGVFAASKEANDDDAGDDAGAAQGRASQDSAVDVAAGDHGAGTVGTAGMSTAAGTNDAAATDDAADAPTADDDVDPSLSAAEVQRRAQEREKAAAGKPVLARVLQVMIAVFFPVMVLAAAIRAVATPLFLWVEYHRPGFPADSFGFSTDDRMTYGSYAVDYLLNWSGSRYLGDLVGDGGEPLYLDTEVSHMADVKTVLTVAFVAATVMAVLSLLAALYLWRRSPGGIRRSLFSGAVLTLVLVAVMVVLAVMGWEMFFTQVHSIFFANGNWTFRMDDTLIRLFPAQFWMDAGIAIAALVLITCTVVLVCCWPTRARRERVQQERADARRRYDESLDAL